MSPSPGRAAPIDPARVTRLRAGELTASFVDGDLRDVRWRGAQIVQRMYMAVRDRSWNTIPATFGNSTLERADNWFSLEFDAANHYEDIALTWHGHIRGDADGSLSYAWTGQALGDFEYCKIGLNVHHALDAYAGRSFAIRTTTGPVEGRFDADIVPQLVRDGSLTAMTDYFDELSVSIDGADAVFAFEGDLFELQDHRNWADANWKSYGTPLSFGFPMAIAAGEERGQTVRVRASGAGVEIPDESARVTCWLDDSSFARLPRIGHLWNRSLSESDVALLRATRPDHVRIDLHADADAGTRISEVTSLCSELACNLEVAAFLRPDFLQSDARAAAGAIARLGAPVDRVLVLQESGGFSEFGGAAPPELAAELGRALTGASVGVPSIVSGTPQSFNDVNRDRPDYSAIDGIVFAFNPQVHAADDDSLLQNTKAVPDIVDFARRLFGDVDVVLSPVDLIGVNGPYPGGPMAPAGRAANEDPRQWGRFGAAWTVAALAEMARCGTTSATFFELSGPRGLVDEGDASDVFAFFRDLALVRDWPMVASASSAPHRLATLAFRRGADVRAVVANLTADRLEFAWDDAAAGDSTALGPYEVLWCDVEPRR